MSSSTGVPDRRLTDEPNFTENARKVLEARYLMKNEAGECIETPGDLFRRVAGTVADVELGYGASPTERHTWHERFYNLMTSGRFMPNSPTLMNAGREMGMLSACFVLPVRDSIVDIFDSIKHTALIQKAGGGTGFAFDELRPTGDFIQSSGGTTSGPITFWRAFSEATNAIQQGAFRRGANMGMMYIHHPDILKFLYAKQDLNQFTNYNISVKLTDTWMKEFQADPDSPHVTRNPRNGKAFVIPRDVDIWKYNVRTLVEVDCVEAVSADQPERYFATPRLTGPLPEELRGCVYTKRDIWQIIVNNAWQTGEPGIVFIDRINQQNPTPHLGRIEATNPCGEQPLLPYEACNLGSVNLGAFVRNACTPQAEVDWAALRVTVQESVRFLDNVIDANNYPLPEIDRICKSNRKIGLGIMGFADALYALNVPYNSAAGVEWGERFMEFVDNEAHAASEQLARARGSFPNWAGSIWQTKHGRLMRNAAVTTVAPTGTISIIANCSGGVEPLFSLAFIRHVLRGQKQGERPLVEVNETFRRVAEQRGFLSDDLLRKIAAAGTVAHLPDVPDDVKRVFVCAHDISPEWHVRMQAGFQQHCDSSISKTINFPHSATVADVESIYHLAFELGCKGVTVYRDGCREFQPMALDKSGDQESDASDGVSGTPDEAEDGGPACSDCDADAADGDGAAPATPSNRSAVAVSGSIEPADLPEIVSGFRIRQMTAFGNMHVKITVDPRSERELEIFAQLGKGGDVANSDLEGICRPASLWLRAGGSLKHLIKQWEGIGSSLQIPTRAGRVMSLPDGLACALKKYVRAKDRFGLRALLLGEVDLADLDGTPPAPHNKHTTSLDRPLRAPDVKVAPSTAGPVGEKRGNGAGQPTPGAAEGQVAEVRRSTPSRLDERLAPEGSARVRFGQAGGSGNGGSALGAAKKLSAGAAVAELVEAPERLRITKEPKRAHGAARVVKSVAAASATPAVTLTEFLATVKHHHDAATGYLVKCPQCGGGVARQEGCLRCASHCGWSAC